MPRTKPFPVPPEQPPVRRRHGLAVLLAAAAFAVLFANRAVADLTLHLLQPFSQIFQFSPTLYSVWLLLITLVAAIAATLILQVLQAPAALYMGPLGALLGYCLLSLAVPLAQSSALTGTFWFRLLAAVVGLSLAFWLLRVVTEHKLRAGLIAVLLVLSFFMPRLASQVDSVQYASKTNDRFQAAVQDLAFTPYMPTYTPPGMVRSQTTLNGLIEDGYHSPLLEYHISSIKVRQNEIRQGQTQAVNFTDNCDISSLYASMAKSLPFATLEFSKSKEKPVPCELMATTPSGKKVYMQQPGTTFFYTQIGKTNVVFRFDNTKAGKYDPAFQPELLNIIDSLQPLPKSEIHKGL